MKRIKDWTGKKLEMRLKRREDYPGSPSARPGILKLYQSFFQKAVGKKRNFKALVLGATPELCDLVLENRGELTVCEASLEAVMKMEEVMRFSLEKAIIVRSSWLNNHLDSNYYDLVLGDIVFINVLSKEQPFLAREIRRLLKKGGYFLTRNVVLGKRYHDLEKIDSDFLNGRTHWFDSLFDLMVHSPLAKKCQQERAINLDQFRKELDKSYQKKIISPKLYFQLKKFQPVGNRTILGRKSFEKILERHFELIPVEQAGDYQYTQDTLIFYLARARK